MKKLLAVILSLTLLLQPFGNIVLAEDETDGAEKTEQVEVQKAPDEADTKQHADETTTIGKMSSEPANGTVRSNATLAAVYYTLTVATHSGTTSKDYEEGANIDITALPLESRSVFSHWSTDPAGYENIITNIYSAETKVTMPKANVRVIANYSPDFNATYNIKSNPVSNGSFTVSQSSGKMNALITINLSPDKGYRVVPNGGVTVTSARFGTISTEKKSDTQYTFQLPADDVYVTVKYELIPEYLWNVAKGTQSNGTITKIEVEGELVSAFPGKAKAGDTVTVTVTPNQHYKVQSVTIREEEVTTVQPDISGNVWTFRMPAKDVTLDLACVEGDDYPWTVNKGTTTNGIIEKISVNGTEITAFPGKATAGSKIRVQTKPNEYYDTNSVTISGATGITPNKVSENIYEFTMPKANITVNATFTSDYYDLAIGSSTYGSITKVEVNGVVKTERPVRAKSGDIIRLTSKANYTYLPSGITISSGTPTVSVSLVSSNKTAREYVYQFTMPANARTATPAYTRDTTFNKTITKVINPTEAGTCTINSSTAATVSAYAGSTVSISNITATKGYALGSVTVVGDTSRKILTVTGTGTSRSFIMPGSDTEEAENVTVIVTFNKVSETLFNVTKSSATNGSFTVNGVNSTTARENDTITVAATPNRGYKVGTVSVNGTPAVTVNGSGNSYNFKMPFRDVQVAVTFVADPDFQWNITKGSMENGTISKIEVSSGGGAFLEKTTAKSGDIVRVTTAPNSTYRVVENGVTVSGTGVTVSKNSENVYQFTMPARDVTVTAVFEPGDDFEYNITKSAAINGTISQIAVDGVPITTFPGKAKAGAEITVTTVPGDTYLTLDVSASYGSSKITATPNTGNVRKFTMPKSHVDVSATFTRDDEYKFDIEAVGKYGQVDTKSGGISVKSAYTGDTITIITTPDMGYKDYTIEVRERINANTLGEIVTATGNTFIMPDFPVRVTVEFQHDDDYEYPKPEVPEPGEGGWWEIPDGSYKPGDTVNIYTYPARGWRVRVEPLGVLALKLQGGDSLPVTTVEKDKHYTFIFPEGGVRVNVIFEPDPNYEWDIIKEAAVNGNFATEKGGVEVIKSKATETVTIKITPYTYYETNLVAVKEPNGTVVPTKKISDNEYTFEMPWNDAIVNVSFKNAATYPYNVMMASTANGSAVQDKLTAPEGETVRITAAPDPGYMVNSVSISGTPDVTATNVSENIYEFKMPPRDVTVTVTYKVNQSVLFNINTQVTEGNGTVKTLKGTTDVTQANAEDVITVTGIPNGDDYVVKSIKVDGKEITVQNNSGTFTMPNRDVTVEIAFGRDLDWEYDIMCLPTENGEFYTDVTKAREGDTVYIYASPNDGCDIGSVIVDGGNVEVYNYRDNWFFYMPAHDVTVEVEFIDLTEYDIDYNYTGGGLVSGIKSSIAGKEIEVYVVPNEGFTLLDISVVASIGGQDIPVSIVDGHYKFTMPKSNVYVYATFIPKDDDNEYNIYKGSEQGGTFEVSKENAKAGEEITITVTPDQDYKIDSINVQNYYYGEIRVRQESEGVYKFFMPAEDVTVYAHFRSAYNDINLGDQINGKYSASKYSAKEGEEITINTTPNLGYKVGYVQLDTMYGRITAREDSKNSYKFDMPDTNVDVYVGFEPDPKQLFNLTLVDGTIEGETGNIGRYPTETWKNISAEVPQGCTFDRWEIIQGTAFISELSMQNTSIRMQASDVVIQAVFSYPPDRTFTLDVVGGVGSGSYSEDTVVNVSLDKSKIPSGYKFSGWYTIASDIRGVYDNLISDKYSETITFTMPQHNVRLVCSYAVDMGQLFKITPAPAQNGSFEVSHEEAYVTELIKINATPDDGYKVGSVKVVRSDNESIQVNVDTSSYTDYQFRMPGYDVTVYVTFIEDPDGYFYITKGQEVNGTFERSKTKAKPEEEITINTTPDYGYKVKDGSVTVKTASGDELDIEVTKVADNEYTFKMPAANVIIDVEFVTAVPGIPMDVAAVGGDEKIALLWNNPISGDEAAAYEVKLGDGNWIHLDIQDIDVYEVDGIAMWVYVFAGLTNGTEYTAQIRAIGSTGISGPEAEATATTVPLGDLGGHEADLVSVAGVSINSSEGEGDYIYDPCKVSIEVPNNKWAIFKNDIAVSTDATAFMYSTPLGFSTGVEQDMISLVAGEAHVYIKVVSGNGEITKYYDITVTRGSSNASPSRVQGLISPAGNGISTFGISDPIDRTVQLVSGETHYTCDMRPQVTGTTKYLYSDPEFSVEVDNVPVAPGETIYLYAKYVENFPYNPTIEYVRLIVKGPPVTNLVYLTNLANQGVSVENGEGAEKTPFEATIWVPMSKTTITNPADIVISAGTAMPLLFTSKDFTAIVPEFSLNVGENHVFIAVMSGGGVVYYDITVYRGHKVTYDANGGSGEVPKDSKTYDNEEKVTVLGKNTLAKIHSTFLGWAKKSDAEIPDYVENDTFKITEDTTLYAVWQQDEMYNIDKVTPENGDFEVPDGAYEGDIVEIENIKPDEGYRVKKIIVKKKSGGEVPVDNDNKFEMPGEEVTVEVEFEKDPDKWITITFKPGYHGTLSGKTVFEVLKGKAWSAYGISLPTVTADSGWKQQDGAAGWSPEIPDASTVVNDNIDFVAQYAKDPDKWITITFAPGDHGTLDGGTPNVTVEAVKGAAWSTVTVPAVAAQVSWNHTGWDPALPATVPDTDTIFTAQYERNKYDIGKVNPENGDFDVPDWAYEGGTVEITNITPDEGYRVKKIIVKKKSGEEVNVGNDNKFIMPGEEVTVKVEFEPDPSKKYKIFKAPASHGIFSVSQEEASVEDLISITPSPDTGYKVGYITVDNIKISGETFTMPARDVTVAVTFVVDTNQLFKVDKAVIGSGSFEVSKTEANVTDEIIITASPARGYRVQSVTVSGTPLVTVNGSGNSYGFTMPARDVTVTVTFVEDPDFLFGITVAPANNGSALTSKTEAKAGETITVAANPNPGYMIGTITVSGGVGTLSAGTYAFTMPKSDVVVSVTFVRDASQWATVTFRAGTDGRLTGTTSFDVVKGSRWSASVTVPRVRSNTGYSFSRWSPALPGASTVITDDMTFTALYTYVGVADNTDADTNTYTAPTPTPSPSSTPAATQTQIPETTPPAAEGSEITPDPVPVTAAPSDYWALVNLILCILGGLLAVIVLIRTLLQKKYDREEGSTSEYKYERQIKQHKTTWVITAIIMGIAGVIVFLLTENINNPMTWVDTWTILNAVILLAEIIGTVVAFKRKKKEERTRLYQ